jgi:hypothetical protein
MPPVARMSGATCGTFEPHDRLTPDIAALIRATLLSKSPIVIARSVSDEAIHISTRGEMDCFAALAMTSVPQ